MLLTVLAENKTAYRNTRVEHTRTLSDTETKYYANFIEESTGDTKKCIADVRTWMASNLLFMNDSKTEFMIIGSHK